MSETNRLSPINFGFQLSRTPGIEYTAQRVSLPSIGLNVARIQTPFTPLPYGSTIDYGQLSVTFLVDEDMVNYFEIVNWMNALGHPETLSQYTGEINSDATVEIQNAAKRPVVQAVFHNVLPTSITPLEFDTTSQSVVYVTATVTFEFVSYNFVVI